MLDVEHRYVPKIDYLCDFQEDIKPFMRNVVTIWMLEVCEDQQCEGQVYPMAINLLDRFLCVCVISRTQLQLAATACLLIASKTRQTRAFSTSLLSLYTNHSVSPEDIRDWELLIVSKLKWDLIGINGHDFASHIIARSPWTADHALLKNHAFTLIALGCTGGIKFLVIRY
ncbi:hypothetical protein AAG570_007782 [Ranatra chinensis]|uniref:Cyclin-like domain-containing protein n=1 Tax=Ranatra chinensis TaxID=642074 RepID=A0ABD0YGB9_9HEMI